GGHEPLPQLGHFLDRLRRSLAEAFERLDHAVFAARLDVGRTERGVGHLAEAPLDRGGAAAGRHGERDAAYQERDEKECEQRQQQRHDQTSMFITLRIQKKPKTWSTIAPDSMMRPIRSSNSSRIRSGLMKVSAMPRQAGSASSTYPVNRPCAVC